MLSILESTTDCVFILDAEWRFTFVNARGRSELAPQHDLVGIALWDAFPEAADEPAADLFRQAMEKRQPSDFELTLSAERRAFEVHACPWEEGIAVFFRPKSGEGERLERREADERLQLAIEATGLGVWDIDLRSGRINASPEFRTIVGLAPEERLSVVRLAAIVADDDRAAFERRFETAIAGQTGDRLDSTYRIIHARTGEERWIRVLGSLLSTGRGRTPRLIGTIQDVTDAKTTEERIRYAANHDSLTSLPNRALFRDRLDDMLAQSGATGGKVGLLLLDLDGFKDINDSLGPDIGDELLTVIGQRLSLVVGKRGFVSRHGGDEFAILLPAPAEAEDLEALALRLQAAIGEPVGVGDRIVEPKGSVGGSIFPLHGTEPKELMKNADVALYAAKARGRGRYVLYDKGMWQPIINRLEQQLNARRAIVDDRILPFYQPKVDLLTGRVVGFEALLRWVHPVRGLRTPEGIWAAFNHPDLAYEIGRRMLDSVLADLIHWKNAGIAIDSVAINVSEPELRRADFVDGVLSRIRASGLPNEIFEFEVTETVFFGRDAESIANTLRNLHREGISIALDDFGTGFASLTHLRQHPIQVIKIDQSFTRELGQSPEAMAIVRAVINLGAGLGMKVVAEGVATTLQRDVLARAKCDIGQGYLFGRPMIAHRVPQYLLLAGSEVSEPAEPAESV